MSSNQCTREIDCASICGNLRNVIQTMYHNNISSELAHIEIGGKSIFDLNEGKNRDICEVYSPH